jgi:hypothetical protein
MGWSGAKSKGGLLTDEQKGTRLANRNKRRKREKGRGIKELDGPAPH